MEKGFKHTEVGLIPEDWEVKNLSEIGETIIGLTYSPKNVKSHGTLVLRSSNIQNGKIAFDDNVFVEMDLPERVIVKENDLLICVRNGSRQLIGKCALIDKKTEGCAFGAFMSIYRSPYSVFVFHQFQSYCIQRQINQTLGATINQLTNKDLASFKIPLPPTKAEQTAIATVLNDADALIQKLEQLIAKKKLIKQGAMQELLKPKEGWEVKKLGELFDILKGNGLSKSKLIPYGKFECILYGELFTTYKEVIRVIKSKTNSEEGVCSRNGDILFPGSTTTTGIDLAKCSTVLKDKVRLGGDIIILRPKYDNIKSEFIVYFLNEKCKYTIAEKTKGVTIYHLHGKDLIDIHISYPQYKEQARIAQILSDMNSEIEALEKQLEKYKKIKQGMMQVLLTGKIRLNH